MLGSYPLLPLSARTARVGQQPLTQPPSEAQPTGARSPLSPVPIVDATRAPQRPQSFSTNSCRSSPLVLQLMALPEIWNTRWRGFAFSDLTATVLRDKIVGWRQRESCQICSQWRRSQKCPRPDPSSWLPTDSHCIAPDKFDWRWHANSDSHRLHPG